MTCVLFPLDQSSHTLSEYMHMYSYACKQCTTHWLSPLRTINFPKMTTHLMSVKTSIRFFSPYK